MNAVVESASNSDLDGSVLIRDDRYTVAFARQYPIAPDRLWANVTEPHLVPGWLGPVERFELRVGGAVDVLLHPNNGAWLRGNVIDLAAPRFVEFTWNVPAHGTAPDFVGGTVRLEVGTHELGAQLLFIHALPKPDRVLDILAATHNRLRQIPSRTGQIAVVDREAFLALRSRYAAAFPDFN